MLYVKQFFWIVVMSINIAVASDALSTSQNNNGKPARININTQPESASVYMDGTLIGITDKPKYLYVTSGSHLMRFVKDSLDVSKEMSFYEGDNSPTRINLFELYRAQFTSEKNNKFLAILKKHKNILSKPELGNELLPFGLKFGTIIDDIPLEITELSSSDLPERNDNYLGLNFAIFKSPNGPHKRWATRDYIVNDTANCILGFYENKLVYIFLHHLSETRFNSFVKHYYLGKNVPCKTKDVYNSDQRIESYVIKPDNAIINIVYISYDGYYSPITTIYAFDAVLKKAYPQSYLNSLNELLSESRNCK